MTSEERSEAFQRQAKEKDELYLAMFDLAERAAALGYISGKFERQETGFEVSLTSREEEGSGLTPRPSPAAQL